MIQQTMDLVWRCSGMSHIVWFLSASSDCHLVSVLYETSGHCASSWRILSYCHSSWFTASSLTDLVQLTLLWSALSHHCTTSLPLKSVTTRYESYVTRISQLCFPQQQQQCLSVNCVYELSHQPVLLSHWSTVRWFSSLIGCSCHAVSKALTLQATWTLLTWCRLQLLSMICKPEK